MSNMIKIKKGLDIHLQGEAEKTVETISSSKFAMKPTDFVGIRFPKLLVKEGVEVKVGTPLFFDKNRENIKITSPVSGVVSGIIRGAKRKLLEIVIDSDDKFESIDFGAANPKDLSREEIIEKMLNSGVWPMVRQRPYSVIANPDDKPKAIFISCFDSAPLAQDNDLIIHNEGNAFQTGIDVLSQLTDGKIHLSLKAKETPSKVFVNSKGVELHYIDGPHPAGNVGVQINHIDPINKGDVIWYLYPQEVLTIGRLFLEGKYNTERIVALAGSEVKRPHYYKTHIGACICNMVNNNVADGKLRYISGNVLTGTKIKETGFISFYHSLVTVIPEGDNYEFFGWALPGLKKFSASRTFVSWLKPNKKYRLDTNIHGGKRAFVMNEEYEKVFPMDIYPVQLIKAIMIEDIDLMENLGIYEVDEEDFALPEVICTSKIEAQSIVRRGLDLMRAEMS